MSRPESLLKIWFLAHIYKTYMKIYTKNVEKYLEIVELKNFKNNRKKQKLRARITTYNLKNKQLLIHDNVFIYVSSVSIDRQAYQSK